MSTIAQNLIAAEAFSLLPETDGRLELVRGRLVQTSFFGARDGMMVAELAARLQQWADQAEHGCVGLRAGFIFGRNPDTVRVPKIWFVGADRMEGTNAPDWFWPIAPDLAVEVVSPSESAADVQEKVRDYLQAGTPLMWIIYPRSEQVVVHTADGVARTLSGDDLLASPDVLPGFACTVSQIFE